MENFSLKDTSDAKDVQKLHLDGYCVLVQRQMARWILVVRTDGDFSIMLADGQVRINIWYILMDIDGQVQMESGQPDRQ